MFEINSTATIKSLNIAKSKADEAPVCVTIGLEFDCVGIEPVAAALGCLPYQAKSFFGENGDNLYTGMTQIESWAEFENCHKLTMLKFECDTRKISKIRLKPLSGGAFSLSCNVQIQDPSDHVIETIAQHLHGTTAVRIDASGELNLEQEQQQAEAA